MCIYACVCGAGTGGPIFRLWWGDRWLPRGRADQARASLEGAIVWANEVWLPCRSSPICFYCFQRSLGNSYPPQGLQCRDVGGGLLLCQYPTFTSWLQVLLSSSSSAPRQPSRPLLPKLHYVGAQTIYHHLLSGQTQHLIIE